MTPSAPFPTGPYAQLVHHNDRKTLILCEYNGAPSGTRGFGLQEYNGALAHDLQYSGSCGICRMGSHNEIPHAPRRGGGGRWVRTAVTLQARNISRLAGS